MVAHCNQQLYEKRWFNKKVLPANLGMIHVLDSKKICILHRVYQSLLEFKILVKIDSYKLILLRYVTCIESKLVEEE